MKYKNGFIAPVALFFGALMLFISLSAAHAQQSPGICQSVAADPDGDGFGFERYQSCQITAESASRPEIVNLETGGEVALIRPYWNANRDIASREIECRFYTYDENQTAYVMDEDRIFEPYVHNELPYSPPYIGEVDGPIPWRGFVDAWTVHDGIYDGPMPIYNANWLELISIDGIENAGVRQWGAGGFESNTEYTQCRDVSGSSFAPTGSFDEQLPQDNNPPVSWSATGVEYQSRMEPVINLATGAPVDLQQSFWDIRNDLLGRQIICQAYQWEEFEGSYESYNVDYDRHICYFHPLPATTEPVGRIFSEFDVDLVPRFARWSIVNGVMQVDGIDFHIHDKVERVEPRVTSDAQSSESWMIRSWVSSENYYECRSWGQKVSGILDGGFYLTDDNRTDLIPTGRDTTDAMAVATDNPESDVAASDDNADASGPDSGGGTMHFFGLLLMVCVCSRRERDS